jgi:two-component system cell cycle sensor histidine kinase/response regulator CckA
VRDERKPMTILAVDDDGMVLNLVRAMLQRHGYLVMVADSGTEALRVFLNAEDRIDLMITDIVMPEMDGTVLAGEIKRRKPELPVLYMSGYADRLEQLDAPVLAKPFSSAALVGTVRKLLRG